MTEINVKEIKRIIDSKKVELNELYILLNNAINTTYGDMIGNCYKNDNSLCMIEKIGNISGDDIHCIGIECEISLSEFYIYPNTSFIIDSSYELISKEEFVRLMDEAYSSMKLNLKGLINENE